MKLQWERERRQVDLAVRQEKKRLRYELQKQAQRARYTPTKAARGRTRKALREEAMRARYAAARAAREARAAEIARRRAEREAKKKAREARAAEMAARREARAAEMARKRAERVARLCSQSRADLERLINKLAWRLECAYAGVLERASRAAKRRAEIDLWLANVRFSERRKVATLRPRTGVAPWPRPSLNVPAVPWLYDATAPAPYRGLFGSTAAAFEGCPDWTRLPDDPEQEVADAEFDVVLSLVEERWRHPLEE